MATQRSVGSGTEWMDNGREGFLHYALAQKGRCMLGGTSTLSQPDQHLPSGPTDLQFLNYRQTYLQTTHGKHVLPLFQDLDSSTKHMSTDVWSTTLYPYERIQRIRSL